MEKTDFQRWLESISSTFLTLNDQQRNQSLDHIIFLSGAAQLRHLSNGLEALLKRDFLRLLPLELAFYLLRWLDPQTLLTCCLVCKQWNKVINSCTEVWQNVCRDLGWRIDESIQDASHWKGVYIKAKLRMVQLKDQKAFETSSLIGHSARVYALYYKDGLLCTGSDDLSAKLWDVRTGQCIYGIQTHTCATVKFDEQKLVTGSFDNTIACWEWSTGAKIQQFRGHTGAVFSVDYNDEMDMLVSGSADFTVKVWALAVGACLNTLTGHTEWVTKCADWKRTRNTNEEEPTGYGVRNNGQCAAVGWSALSRSGIRSCPKWRSSSILGSCSRVREEWNGRSTGGSVQTLH
ncbi:F-box/WD repeat-containing protein 2 isoform X5 [Phyllopteryx taeniolatus]|uniref:F-box/WD repeat-containing protein 2 isoform X5 n=1 Tax=Phyllopteryx taeniolatus TaxID=161469 RepID=UPI002AD2C497|nr:F-box/WD repeat-containing protein 2 isoform X5 [Phyllopteryx taeniolatus]